MSVLGAGEAFMLASGDAAHTIERSLRFDSSASSHLTKTPSSAGNRKKWTWSGWVKRSKSGHSDFFAAVQDSNNATIIQFDNNDRLDFEDYQTSNVGRKITTQVFRDFSAWYHIVAVYDSNNATADDRIILYVNGSRVTEFAQSNNPSSGQNSIVNSTNAHYVGVDKGFSNHYLDGYLAEVHFVDGQALAPTDFGEVNADTGAWDPIKFTGSHNAAADGLGGVTWSSYVSGPVNSTKPLSLCFGGTIGSGYQNGTTATGGNALTLNVSALNLTVTNVRLNSFIGGSPGTLTVNGSNVSYSGSGDQTQVVAVNGQLNTIVWGYDNGNNYVYMRGIEVDLGDGSGYRLLTDGAGAPAGVNGFHLDFSNNSSNAALGTDSSGNNNTWTVNNLAADAPGLSTANQGFNVVTYSGNGSNGRAIDLGFQPDFLWIKRRDGNLDHGLWDSVRGSGKELYSNRDYAEGSTSNLGGFTSTGFTANNNALTNQNGYSYVAWAWKAGGSSVSNTNGTITSSVSANNTYGFSVVAYTGNSTAGATIGHGLSTAPSLIIIKNRSRTVNWAVGHSGVNGFANGNQLRLNTTGALASSEEWFNNTNPTSSVFTVKNNYEVNYANDNYVAYCWSEVSGFSKFGGYSGNSDNTNVTNRVIDCGFKPKYVLIKCSSNSGEEWMIFDGARNTSNPRNLFLKAESTNADGSYAARHISFVDNGFKFEGSNGQEPLNLSGRNYIFAAYADVPDGSIIDSLIDTPTDYEASNGNNGGNYATWNPLQKYAAITLSNGNLDFTDSNSVNGGDQGVHATIAPVSGKFYWELTLSALASENYIGISKTDKLTQTLWTGGAVDGYYYYNNGKKIGGGNGNGGETYGTSFGAGDVIGVAVDWDNGKVTFYKNGASQGDAFTGKDLTGYVPAFYFNTNQSSAGVVNFGQRPFTYTPPTGYKSLCTQNLDDPLIADPSTAFEARTYTGVSGASSQTGYNFGPDFVWIKRRNTTNNHTLTDSVRGAGYIVQTNNTNAQIDNTAYFTGFTSDGYSFGTDGGDTDAAGGSYVAWAWDGGDLVTNSAYDQSQAWSSALTSSTGFRSSEPATNAFDGSTSTICSAVGSGLITFAPTGTFPSNSAIRIYLQGSGSQTVTVNGGASQTITGNSWQTVNFTNSSASSFTLTIQASGGTDSGLRALEIGGKILVAPGFIPVGGLNSSVYDQSQTWTNQVSGTENSSYPFSNIFNADNMATHAYPANGTEAVFTPNPSFSNATTVKIWYYAPSLGNNGIKLNGNGVGDQLTTTSGTLTHTFDVTGTGFTSLAWSKNLNNTDSGLLRIDVDGKQLVDSSVSVTDVPAVACTVRANQSAGFSIVKVDNPTNTQSRAHGLNKKPDLIICKSLASADSWHTYHSSLGYTKYINLNGTGPATSSDQFGSQEPDSNLFYVKPNTGSGANKSGGMIYYIWNAVENYSAFGSYSGNGSATDGPFVFTGFEIAFLLLKESSGSDAWLIWDNARQDYNPQGPYLQPQATTTEGDADLIDFLSNGFKLRTTTGSMNQSGQTYIYAAFASMPQKFSRAA